MTPILAIKLTQPLLHDCIVKPVALDRHNHPNCTRLAVAREHAGVNTNVLAPGRFVDVPSGNAAVNGIPVEVVASVG